MAIISSTEHLWQQRRLQRLLQSKARAVRSSRIIRLAAAERGDKIRETATHRAMRSCSKQQRLLAGMQAGIMGQMQPQLAGAEWRKGRWPSRGHARWPCSMQESVLAGAHLDLCLAGCGSRGSGW